MRKRRNHEAGFKARVALEAVKGERSRVGTGRGRWCASDGDPPVEEGSA